tara:strand:+ start:470 stop:1192 length:723 start_codon:yes stop_codon:yes gene_type:complete
MTGTLLNVSLIIFGVLFYGVRRRELGHENQQLIRVMIAGLVLYTGFRLLWQGLSGTPLQHLGQLALVLVSMSLGKTLGSLMRLQEAFNQIAVFAKDQLQPAASDGSPPQKNAGFLVATGLFCLTPMAFIGGVVEGANHDHHPLLIKSMMDGLAAISFTRQFGYGVILSAIPVLAFQGTLTLLTHALFSHLAHPGPAAALQATSGCLIFSVILLVFGIQKIRLADYLPCLVIAPSLASLWW